MMFMQECLYNLFTHAFVFVHNFELVIGFIEAKHRTSLGKVLQ